MNESNPAAQWQWRAIGDVEWLNCDEHAALGRQPHRDMYEVRALDVRVADAQQPIRPDFESWFGREWDAFEDKEVTSRIKSKVWALKAFRAFAANTPSNDAIAPQASHQKLAVDCGFEYWRASDAHGITGTADQAIDFIQRLVGVEVEIEDALRDNERAELEMFRRDLEEQVMLENDPPADALQASERVGRQYRFRGKDDRGGEWSQWYELSPQMAEALNNAAPDCVWEFDIRDLYATPQPPPAPIDKRDRDISQLIDERDAFEHWCTVLSDKIGELLGADVGEWSSANIPPLRALNLIDERLADPAVALTDRNAVINECIDAIMTAVPDRNVVRKIGEAAYYVSAADAVRALAAQPAKDGPCESTCTAKS